MLPGKKSINHENDTMIYVWFGVHCGEGARKIVNRFDLKKRYFFSILFLLLTKRLIAKILI